MPSPVDKAYTDGVSSLSAGTFNALVTEINAAFSSVVSKGTLCLDVKDYGAIGNDTADDRAAIQSALNAAAALGSAGQRVKVLIPPGVYRCGNEILPGSNTVIENQGHLKFTGGNAVGGFCTIRAKSNVEIYGGIWDSNSQENDNTIAIGFVNANQTVAGPACENIWIHDLVVANSKHGGSHIADINDPADVGRGGGKGVTVQFGCKKIVVSDVIVDNCDLGWSIEGKEADAAYAQDIIFSNVISKNCKYMGAFLTSVGNTASLYGQVTSVLLDNIEIVDCGVGQTTEAVPRDIATLFGAITTQGMIGVMARNVRVRSTTGKLTVFRGAQRACNWDVQVFSGSTLVDVVNTAPYGGHSPVNIAWRWVEMAVDVIHTGTTATFTGYLVNSNATYPANFSTFRISAINLNNGAVAAVPTGQYAVNFPADSMMVFKDRHSGRLITANNGASLTPAVSSQDTFFNGLGVKDDSANNQVKIATSRSLLSLADSANATQARVETGQFVIQNILTLGTAVGSGGQYIRGFEQSADPAAPAVNAGILYFKDNGAGKTQLVARFNTGAVQVIATEP